MLSDTAGRHAVRRRATAEVGPPAGQDYWVRHSLSLSTDLIDTRLLTSIWDGILAATTDPQAIGALPCYRRSHPGMAETAHRTLRAVLDDDSDE